MRWREKSSSSPASKRRSKPSNRHQRNKKYSRSNPHSTKKIKNDFFECMCTYISNLIKIVIFFVDSDGD